MEIIHELGVDGDGNATNCGHPLSDHSASGCLHIADESTETYCLCCTPLVHAKADVISTAKDEVIARVRELRDAFFVDNDISKIMQALLELDEITAAVIK